ncbi:MAG: hypothetical protein QNJ11_13730 [Woeseiaceae bacterium]|nr:hypothetical protein [Woeseiaceae bacterium]
MKLSFHFKAVLDRLFGVKYQKKQLIKRIDERRYTDETKIAEFCVYEISVLNIARCSGESSPHQLTTASQLPKAVYGL